MLGALDYWHADRREMHTAGAVGLTQLLLDLSPAPPDEPTLAHDVEAGMSLAGVLRLDDRTELGRELGLTDRETAALSDRHLALVAYRRWGPDLAERLRGDFAFIVHDARHNRLFGCRDPFGVKPFYYVETPDVVACASEMKALLALPFVDRTVNEAWVVDLVCRLFIDGDGTFWQHIRRLEPAHCLVVEGATVTRRRYWSVPLDGDVRFATEGDYVEALRDALDRAVHRRITTTSPVGAELSGGLDSSGVVAAASSLLRHAGRPLRTYAQVRPDGPLSEPLPDDSHDAIKAFVAHAALDAPRLLTGEDNGCVDTIDRAAAVYDEPPQLGISLMNDRLFDAARADGVRVLLSGFGGNQCVSASGHQVAWELLRRARLIDLWRTARAEDGSRSTARALLTSIQVGRVASAIAGVRRGSFSDPKAQKLPYRGLRREMAVRHDLRGRYRQYLDRYSSEHAVRAVAAARLTAPDVAVRLEYSHIDTLARGLEYRFPLLDRDLIELFMAFPSHMKWRGGIGRWLFRKSLAGRVPESVAWFTTPASANPGSVIRLRRDAPRFIERLHAIPRDARVFEFVDRDRLLAQPQVRRGRAGGHAWDRTADLVRVLLLHEKLLLAEAPR